MRGPCALIVLAVVACTPDKPDGSCFTWSDCGAGGACEYGTQSAADPARFECSFADSSCPAGRRFGEFASPGVADTCVEPFSGIDGLCDDAHPCDAHFSCELGRCINVAQLDGTAQLFAALCSDRGATGGDLYLWGIAFALKSDPILPDVFADAVPLLPGQTHAPVEGTLATAGANHACLVGRDGLSDCLGLPNDPAVGGGPTGSWAFQTPLGPHLAIAGGTTHSCGTHATTVDCWGANGDAQLDGTKVASTLATVDVGQPVTQITAGKDFTCAGTPTDVWCWGAQHWTTDTFDGPRGTVARVLGLDAGPVTALDAGESHVCAIKGGHVWCWGGNAAGQSSGVIGGVAIGPSKPLGDTVAIAVVAGKQHSCAVLEDHTMTCWGDDFLGQLATPDLALEGRAVGPLAAGDNVTCAVLEDSFVHCWGDHTLTTDVQLGDTRLTLGRFPACVF